MTDIRELLQRAEEPSPELDEAISKALGLRVVLNLSTDYTYAIEYIEEVKHYDWTMGNVNGQVGGTPYGCVGVPQDLVSYSATPLLSLWLSYFRLELGDERPRTGEIPVLPQVQKAINSGEKVYAIGYCDKPDVYGMAYGPTDLGDCMSYYPTREESRGRNAHLLRLLRGGQHEVEYVWDWESSDWQEPLRG